MIYRQSLGAAYVVSSGSCLDALAPASGEGDFEKSDERRARSVAPRRMYTSHDNDIFVIACLTIGRAHDSFSYDCNIVVRNRYVFMIIRITYARI